MKKYLSYSIKNHVKLSTKIFQITAIILTGIIFFSCSQNKVVASLESEKLFNIEYGSFEDEINLFNLARVSDIKTRILMKDGFFYITDTESKKILKTNSYGNLLNLYYNPETNPKPSFEKQETSSEATQNCTEYGFNEIEAVAVDNRKFLYVVDKLPVERQETDFETKQIMNQIVLRFDGDGKFIDYLGQQGPGGTPFPKIMDIFTTEKNELVVICRVIDGFTAYWYSSGGASMYIIPFLNKYIPNPYEKESNLESYLNIDRIVPDYQKNILYLKIDYSLSYIDEASKVQSGIDFKESLLYPFNVETGIYDKAIRIPSYTEQEVNGLSTVSYNIPYEFIGVTNSGWFFFKIGTEEGYNIQMVQPNGQSVLNRRLNVNPEENYYYSFNLSDEGILSVLLAQKENAVIQWWRTDDLIEAIIKK